MRDIYITDKAVIYNDMPKGWLYRKTQPKWHYKVYMMWRNMWKRVYTELHWFGSLIHPSFKYLSNYADWVKTQPRFEDFCTTCDTIKWSVDKDAKYPGNKNYYPEYMTLMLGSDNSKDMITRNGAPSLKRMKPVIGISLDSTNKIILAISIKYVSNYGFDPSAVSKCIRKIHDSHKGYKWYKANYKHNKHFRVK